MAATGAQGGDAAFVIAARVADLVGRQRRMVQPRFCDVSHASSFCLDDLAASGATLLRMAPAMKRAVMGVPS